MRKVEERLVVPFSNCDSRIAGGTAERTLASRTHENRAKRNTEALYRYFADLWTVVDR